MNTQADPRPLRVVQWATGNIGLRALREVIRHPALELVGVLVYDDAKVGVDAGELCGEAPVGVAATGDPEAITALRADAVLYMPRRFRIDEAVGLLAAGSNVVTTCAELHDDGHPLGAEGRSRLLDACTLGGSSIYATGSSPGFITDVLPFALLSLQRDVESIAIDEFANLSQRDSPHLLFEQMGYGKPLEWFDDRRAGGHLRAFAPALGVLARAAGLDVHDWTVSGEVAAARTATLIAAGEIAAGTIGAQRATITGVGGITGHRGDDAVVSFATNWYCTTDLDASWELRPTGWRVQVRGDAPFDVDLTFPIPLADLGAFTPAYTANRPVNAIAHVCAAPPGIVSPLDLPPITPAGPARDR